MGQSERLGTLLRPTPLRTFPYLRSDWQCRPCILGEDGFYIADRHPHPELQDRSQFAQFVTTLEEQAKSIGFTLRGRATGSSCALI